MTSGNKIVDMMEEINIAGDVTSINWYKWITKTTPSGEKKPDLLATIILSNICYWYKPTVIRDERTDIIIEKKQKFSADLLQKQYSDYSEMFGQPKSAVKASMDTLENLGLIKRHFRDCRLENGTILNNRMFIEIFPDKIKQITFNAPYEKECNTLPQKSKGDSAKKHKETPKENKTYTENTTENTTEITTTSAHVVDESTRLIFATLSPSLNDLEIAHIVKEAKGNLSTCRNAVSFVENYKGPIDNLPGLIISFIRKDYQKRPVYTKNANNIPWSNNLRTNNIEYFNWECHHSCDSIEELIKSAEEILGCKIPPNLKNSRNEICDLVYEKYREIS